MTDFTEQLPYTSQSITNRTEIMDINQYPIQDIFEELDDNNREMVNRLMEAFPVEFRVWQNKYYSAILKTIGVPSPKIVILYYPPISQEKIAHELLHMFCQLSLGTNECILSTPDDDGIYNLNSATL